MVNITRKKRTRLYREIVAQIRQLIIHRDANDSDVSFHLALARATQNTILYNIMTMLSGLMKEAYGPSRKELLKDPAQTQIWCDQNFKIYEAIKNRDPDRASKLIREHLQMAEDKLKLLIDENDGE